MIKIIDTESGHLGLKPNLPVTRFSTLGKLLVSPCECSLKNTLLASFIKVILWTSSLNTEQKQIILDKGWRNYRGCQQHLRLLLIWCTMCCFEHENYKRTERGQLVSLLSTANDQSNYLQVYIYQGSFSLPRLDRVINWPWEAGFHYVIWPLNFLIDGFLHFLSLCLFFLLLFLFTFCYLLFKSCSWTNKYRKWFILSAPVTIMDVSLFMG